MEQCSRILWSETQYDEIILGKQMQAYNILKKHFTLQYMQVLSSRCKKKSSTKIVSSKTWRNKTVVDLVLLIAFITWSKTMSSKKTVQI